MLEIPVLLFVEWEFEEQRTEAEIREHKREIKVQRMLLKEARRMRVYEALVEADKQKRDAWLANENLKDEFFNKI